jgi:uncharacterized protein HemX
MRNYIITGAVCFILGALVCAGLAYRISTQRIDQLGGQLDQAAITNRQLAGSLEQREVVISELRSSIDKRQGILDAAGRELESSKNSIAKIRAILELLKAGQLDSSASSPREYYSLSPDTR